MGLQSNEVAAALNSGGDVRVGSIGEGRGGESRGAPAGLEGVIRKAANAKQVAVIDVGGMTCAICVGVVEKLLGRYALSVFIPAPVFIFKLTVYSCCDHGSRVLSERPARMQMVPMRD